MIGNLFTFSGNNDFILLGFQDIGDKSFSAMRTFQSLSDNHTAMLTSGFDFKHSVSC